MRAVPGVRSLVFPDSIAVVGASPRNVAAVETVVASGVRAWGVNPNRDEVAGLRCYPRVADLPETPECAFLMVNHERVEDAFEEAAAAGVRAFVVPGVGAEAGAAARPTTERLAARARELGAAMLGPNCMGVFAPGGPAAWNGQPQDTTAPGGVAVLCQSGSIADAFLSLGGRDRDPVRRLLGRRGGHRRRGLPRVLRGGRRDDRGRALPRDRPPARCVRRRAAPLRRRGEARRVPQGRALRGCGPCGALAHGSSRRLEPGLLGRSQPLLGDRGRGLPRARRDARDPRTEASADRDTHRRHLGIGRRVRAPRRPRGGGGHPVRAALGRPRRVAVGGLPELPRSRKPARRVGDRGRDGGVPALARAPRRVGGLRRPPRPGGPLPVPRSDERRVVRADAPHARAPARRPRDAVLLDDDGAQRRSPAPLPGARPRARRASAPRPARRDARDRTRGTAAPVRALAREQRPGRRRPPRPGGDAARARVVARPRAARCPVRSQAPRVDPGRSGERGGRTRHARRREVGRRRAQGPRREGRPGRRDARGGGRGRATPRRRRWSSRDRRRRAPRCSAA